MSIGDGRGRNLRPTRRGEERETPSPALGGESDREPCGRPLAANGKRRGMLQDVNA